VLAPSVHNTQPWWFSEDEHEISVYTDVERRLGIADRAGRERLISCGAALFNIRAHVVGVGPMLQSLALPVNDLSRRTLVDDVVCTIALTAAQAQAGRRARALPRAAPDRRE
jgi:hypothetical protein